MNQRFFDVSMKFFPWLMLVLVWLLAWQLAGLFWQLIKQPNQTADQFNVPALVAPEPVAIAPYNIFASKPISADSAVAPTTIDVPMKLEGVVLGKGGASSALIKVNEISRHYRVGQLLEGTQIQLVKVAWNYIEVKPVGGQVAKLKFGESQAQPIASPATVMPTVQTESSNPDSANASASASTQIPVPSNDRFMGRGLNNPARQRQQIETRLDASIDQLRQNPSGYLNQMGVSPTSNGYEVGSGGGSQYFTRMGLQAGDKVMSVNGRPVGDPRQDAQLLEQVKLERRAEIVFQRGGQTLTVVQQW